MLTALAVQNYRSLRHLVIPLGPLNVVTGPNGSGKSSLYRALRLLADTSRNGAVAALARQGGLASTLWAGPEHIGRAGRAGRHPQRGSGRTTRVGLQLGFATDDLGYAIDFGLPVPGDSAFDLDPEIKCESIWHGAVLRASDLLAERANGTVRIRESGGSWPTRPSPIRHFDSMLSEFADPHRAPELLALRERMRSWRFYDHFRTDADAPARASRIGTRTPVLGHDGADLAAALQTIIEIGDRIALDSAIERAFPGSRIAIVNERGRFDVQLQQPGLLRSLGVAELSDGTLRYLLWVAALLTPRPPELLVLNEPETSLHPELLPSLGELVAAAAARTQIITVTHSRPLIDAVERGAGLEADPSQTIELYKDCGETRIAGQRALDEPSWHWPRR